MYLNLSGELRVKEWGSLNQRNAEGQSGVRLRSFRTNAVPRTQGIRLMD